MADHENSVGAPAADATPLPVTSAPPAADSQSFLERLVGTCSSNIRRHARAPIIELTAVVFILGLISYVVIDIATLQGRQNDSKREDMAESLKNQKTSLNQLEFLLQQAQQNVDQDKDAAAKKAPGTAETQSPLDTVKYHADQLKRAQSQYSDAFTQYQNDARAAQTYKSPPVLSDSLLYGAGALFIIILSVFVSLYRMHLREITKNEFYKFAILRVGMSAANASTPGYDSDLRAVIVKGAFDIPEEGSVLRLGRKLESPLPGHLTTDLITGVVNKILDQMDVVLKPSGNFSTSRARKKNPGRANERVSED